MSDAGASGNRFIAKGGKVDPSAMRAALAGHHEHAPHADHEGLRHLRFELRRDLNKRLDRYLTDRITFMSRTSLARLVEDGGVKVNGREAKPSTRLRVGDVVEVVVPPPPATEIQPENIPLEILHEDDDLIVLNKRADIIVHPARSHHSGTLLNALVHHFEKRGAGELSSVGEHVARPGVVHRLDRDTSGVMVVAKRDEAHWRLGRQFENRTVDKRYLAVVEGVIETDADVVDAPLGPHVSKARGLREKQMVRHDELGKPAVTIYRVRQRFRRPRDVPDHLPEFSIVELEIKTGRTHQIRVHLAHLGYPIVGDDMYGGPLLNLSHLDPQARSDAVMHRQALHSAMLEFEHPTSRQRTRFGAPFADDLRRLVELLRAHRITDGVRTFGGCVVPESVVDGGGWEAHRGL